MIFETVTDLAIWWLGPDQPRGGNGKGAASGDRAGRHKCGNAMHGGLSVAMLAQISRGAETWSVRSGCSWLA